MDTEHWMIKSLTAIFDEQPLASEDLMRLFHLFKTSASRLEFGMWLNQQRVKKKILVLSCFEQLAELMRSCLQACTDSDDFTAAKLLINMGSTFYAGEGRKREFLQNRLRNEPILRNVRLWEELFFEQVAQEKSHMEGPRVEGQQRVAFKSLPQEEQDNAIQRFRNVVFGQLGTYAFNMLECGVDEDAVRTFAKKMCAATELSSDDEEQLMDSIEAAVRPTEHPAHEAIEALLSGLPLASDLLSAAMIEVTHVDNPSVRRMVGHKLTSAGRVSVPESSFGQLCAMIGAMLNACGKHNDYIAAGLVAQSAELIDCSSLTIATAIRAHPIWDDLRVWHTLFETMLMDGYSQNNSVELVCRHMTEMGADTEKQKRFTDRLSLASPTSSSSSRSASRVVAVPDPLDARTTDEQERERQEKETWLRETRREWESKYKKRLALSKSNPMFSTSV